MSFTSQRAALSNQLNTVHEVQGYEKAYLSQEVRHVLDELGGNFIVKLYNDLLKRDTANDLQQFLNDFYKHANDYAKECLLIAMHPSHLYGKKIRSWTDHSLHAFDCFLIKLVNDKLKKTIPKRSDGKVYESDTYYFLISLGGELRDIGEAFKSVYEARNKMTHIQYEDVDGKRKIVHWEGRKFRQIKELILMQYHNAFQVFDKLIASDGIQ